MPFCWFVMSWLISLSARCVLIMNTIFREEKVFISEVSFQETMIGLDAGVNT